MTSCAYYLILYTEQCFRPETPWRQVIASFLSLVPISVGIAQRRSKAQLRGARAIHGFGQSGSGRRKSPKHMAKKFVVVAHHKDGSTEEVAVCRTQSEADNFVAFRMYERNSGKSDPNSGASYSVEATDDAISQ